jgi:hypothetical protein
LAVEREKGMAPARTDWRRAEVTDQKFVRPVVDGRLLLSRWAWRLGPAPGDQQTAGRASARALADRSIVPVQEKKYIMKT